MRGFQWLLAALCVVLLFACPGAPNQIEDAGAGGGAATGGGGAATGGGGAATGGGGAATGGGGAATGGGGAATGGGGAGGGGGEAGGAQAGGAADDGGLDAGADAGSDAGVDGGCTSTVTCAGVGANCGVIDAGCGGTPLDCGVCMGTDTCGGAGAPNVCGCTPKTCAQQGFDCGAATDLCGGALSCGTCSLPQTCGSATPNQCAVPATCTNLCLRQVSCADGGTTSLTGKVYAPNGTDPLPNVRLYVPNAAVQPFAPGVACDQCANAPTGSPLVSAITDETGTFSIANVPVGTNVPLVIQTGRWRRQVTIPSIAACQANAAPATLTRLPKNKTEGDIPKIAFATGAVDVPECALRKFGVSDTEFTTPAGTGRIHLYVGDGTINIPGAGGGTYNLGGANAGAGTPSEAVLVGSLATMRNYDQVFFACKGGEKLRTASELSNLVSYANAGGRVSTTHYEYVWLYANAPFNGTALWNVNQTRPVDQNGLIDLTFSKSQTMAAWLLALGATTSLGVIPLGNLARDFDSVVPPARSWISVANPNTIVHYGFNTPVGAPLNQQCGRVMFSDFHVEDHGFVNQNSAYGLTFPAECSAGPMTPQEKLLEYLFFDLGACLSADTP